MPYRTAEERRAYQRAYREAVKAGNRAPRKGVSLRTASDIQCDTCGRVFYRSPANRLKRGTHSYCSRECMASAYVGRMVGENSPRWKGTESRPCGACGKAITRPRWAWNHREMTFCDSSCFGVWKAQNWTGNANPVWKGGHPLYYGANWKRQQRDARRRDQHVCQFCGVPESGLRRALDVHHIRPFRLFGVERYKEANALANLISLCDRCHTYLERFCEDGAVEHWSTLSLLGREGRQTM